MPDLYEEFSERLLARMRKAVVGDPADPREALARANAVEYRLSAATFTSTLATARRFTDEAQAGVIHINSPTTGAEVYVPLGGIKASGWGWHEQGRAALDFYTESVTVYEDA